MDRRRHDLPSSCVLLFNYADKNTHDFFIEGSYPSAELVRDVYRVLVSTGLKRIELSAGEIAKRAGARNEMAVQSSLYLLERAGHIHRLANAKHFSEPTSKPPWETNTGTAGVSPATVATDQLQRNPGAAREPYSCRQRWTNKAAFAPACRTSRGARARKLREMIEFCYTEACYRAAILDYFGDRHHARQCGSCGNCAMHSAARAPLSSSEMLSGAPAANAKAETIASLRPLTEDESLCVRKILACAARMKGRFGKSMLAATLRGSASKNVMQAHLNELSTYGLLRNMRQDHILLYVDALTAARCLRVRPGAYPTVSITELGERVMREQERIELALAAGEVKDEEDGLLPSTALQTYTLFRNGQSVAEIAAQRNLVTKTIEGHLIECIAAGLAVDITNSSPIPNANQIAKPLLNTARISSSRFANLYRRALRTT